MLWVKAFHIIFVITWFAALFYLPRLFVYHCQSKDTISINRFKIMEKKLFSIIMTPSAILTVFSGLWMLVYSPKYDIYPGWMKTKMILVIVLLLFHLACFYHMIKFRSNQNAFSEIYFRVFNEVPSVILISIIILVVVKPF